MTETERGIHPDLDRLAEHAAGRLPESEASAVADHLRSCPLCALESKRLARFAAIDGDAELLAEAAWPRAELLLQRAYADRVRPALAGAGAGAAGTRRRRAVPRVRWLAAAAAAAAVVLLFVGNVERSPRLPLPAEGPDLLRGGEGGTPGATGITLLTPLGELAAPPAAFAWRAERPCETYTLTVFTPELATLLKREGLTESRYALSDSLRGLLAANRVYVWSVQGQTGLTPSAASPSGWFRIVRR